MSMPALLSHFGINTARYVTTDGQVIFDGVTYSGAGYHHATFGRVTPVSQHTFHGGEDPSDKPMDKGCPWPYSIKEVSRHIDAMKASFPNFTYLPPGDDHPPLWIGEIYTGRGKFRIAVTLKRDRGLPVVNLVGGPRLGVHAGGRWIPSPHLYLNGNLCVADQSDWNVEEHTAATVTAWAAHWLAAYTEWRFSRRWPTKGLHLVAP